MPPITKSIAIAGAGSSISKALVRTTDGVDAREIALPPGLAGTLSTRTDNDTGVLTVATGHGVTTSNTVDVFWAGGRRYGVTVTATTATTISIDVGSGDNLPVVTTAIVVAPQVQINATIDGDAASIIGLSLEYANPSSTAVGHADFQDVSNATVTQQNLVANSPKSWDIAGGDTNAFTGNVIQRVMAANGSATDGIATLKIIWGTDSTP